MSATLHVPDPRMLAIVLAAVTAVLPGVFAIVRSDTPDMSYERRLPSALPVDSIYDDVQGYQKFFEDRLGWRREFIVARNKAAAAIGVSPSPLARLGRGNWLFNASGKSLLDRAGLVHFGDETVHRLQAEFKRRTEFWARRGIRYYFLLGPEKSSIYPEHLGALFPVGETVFDQTYRRHGEAVLGSNFVDPRDVLRRHNSPDNYYATDSHWNVLGAQLAHDALLKRMSKDFPDLRAIPRSSDIRWRTVTGMDLVPTGLEAQYPDQEPYFADANDRCVPVSSLPDTQWPGYVGAVHPGFATCPGRPLRVLVVHDSFGMALQRFLGPSFEKSLYLWAPSGGEIPGELVERASALMGGVDAIIQERVERALLSGVLE